MVSVSQKIKDYLKSLHDKGEDISVLSIDRAVEIANMFGVSKSTVYNVKKKLLKELQAGIPETEKKEEGLIQITAKPKETIPTIQPEIQQPIDQQYIENTLYDTFSMLNKILKSMDIDVKDGDLTKELANRWSKVVVQYGIEIPKEMALVSAVGLTAYIYGYPIAMKFLSKPEEKQEEGEKEENKEVYEEE